MRFFNSLLLLSVLGLAQAQEQKPLMANLQSWFDKAKEYVSNAVPAPVDAGAATVAERQVTELTLQNWQSVLAPGPEAQNWMVLITGGNKTCHGRCGPLDTNFNKTAALLAADPAAPHLGRVNCEKQGVLCSIWFTGPPNVWYMQLPSVAAQSEGEAKAPTTIYTTWVNATTTTAQDLVDIHAKKTYESKPPLDSLMHPYDGKLAEFGLNVPIGYLLYFIQLIPSWGAVLLISFITRTMIGKRVGAGSRQQAGGERRKVVTPANIPLGGAPSANEGYGGQ